MKNTFHCKNCHETEVEVHPRDMSIRRCVNCKEHLLFEKPKRPEPPPTEFREFGSLDKVTQYILICGIIVWGVLIIGMLIYKIIN